MALPASTANDLTLHITQEIRVNAPLDVTFEALLEQMGPANQTPEGVPLPMRIEPRPGGRWYRDLGHDDGHLWGFVQAIKRPTLLEITGPLFMSYAAVSNIQYRLTPVDGGTLITFQHSAIALMPEEHRAGLSKGWAPLNERVKRAAEGAARG